jgi:hypothetical protein
VRGAAREVGNPAACAGALHRAADLLAVVEIGDDEDGAERFGAGGSGRKFLIDFDVGVAEVRRYYAKLEVPDAVALAANGAREANIQATDRMRFRD